MKQCILIFFIIFTISFNSLALSQNKQEQEKYSTYTNDRYGFSISYPSNVLIGQGESDSGDGQQFLSKDKKVEVFVFASFVVEEAYNKMKRLYLDDSKNNSTQHPQRVVTYKVLKNNMFVISGYEDKKIFYQKTTRNCNDSFLVTFMIFYDKEQKNIFDPIITKMANSITIDDCNNRK
jgi:hypothetical protein